MPTQKLRPSETSPPRTAIRTISHPPPPHSPLHPQSKTGSARVKGRKVEDADVGETHHLN